MQAYKTQVAPINQTQSLAAVHTLLKAGLGCIAYIRNLLPDDHFAQSHFTSNTDGSFSIDQNMESKAQSEPSINSFKVHTVMRGCSEEADKLLNHMEYGIFDALEKRYLRRFILGIHLDEKDPNNIVEAYTFDIKYCAVKGIATPVPVLTLGDNLGAMSLGSSRSGKGNDPVSTAMKEGRLPTVADVKKSVKALLRRLIESASHMEPLPQRRYASFKLMYDDATPKDYEPPTFMAGDPEKSKWYFLTHGKEESPDKYHLGGMYAGHHAVNLTVASVASFLPSNTDRDEELFAGLASASQLVRSLEASSKPTTVYDNTEKSYIWSADELSDEDAEGEDDPDYCSTPSSEPAQPASLGFSQESQAPCFSGRVLPVPQRVADISATREAPCSQAEDLPATQLVMSPKDLDCEVFARGRAQSPISAGTPMDVDPPQSEASSHPSGSEYTRTYTAVSDADKGLECDCEITKEDSDCIQCDTEGGCSRWFHAWCMGGEDPSIPDQFFCFDCRLKKEPTWGLINNGHYKKIIVDFRGLALFRRALKVAQTTKTLNATNFVKKMGCPSELGSNLLGRLCEEGFIFAQPNPSSGVSTRGAQAQKNAQRRTKVIAGGKAQRTTYAFCHSALRTRSYLDYFTPTGAIESGLLRLADLAKPVFALDGAPKVLQESNNASRITGENEEGSQTQEDSQYPFQSNDVTGSVRHRSGSPLESSRPSKRLKVSVTAAVNLAE